MGCVKWYKSHSYSKWTVTYSSLFFVQQKRVCTLCGVTEVKETEY